MLAKNVQIKLDTGLLKVAQQLSQKSQPAFGCAVVATAADIAVTAFVVAGVDEWKCRSQKACADPAGSVVVVAMTAFVTTCRFQRGVGEVAAFVVVALVAVNSSESPAPRRRRLPPGAIVVVVVTVGT